MLYFRTGNVSVQIGYITRKIFGKKMFVSRFANNVYFDTRTCFNNSVCVVFSTFRTFFHVAIKAGTIGEDAARLLLPGTPYWRCVAAARSRD